MKFYDEIKPLYLETDASGIELGATLYKWGMEHMPKEYSTKQHHT